jgi:hypothetical protein
MKARYAPVVAQGVDCLIPCRLPCRRSAPASSLLIIVARAFAVLSPAPAARALGPHLGPFHLQLPFGGSRHHNRMARSEPSLPEQEATSRPIPALIYPVLAWPSLYDDIFWPRSPASWQFSYQDIFDQAFARYPLERSANPCPYRDTTAEIVARIAREVAPTDAQKVVLQKLATALGHANGYLTKSYPSKVPAGPVARLQLMEAQIDATIMALNIVRPPLQAFEKSLDDQQRAKLNEMAPAAATVADACQPTASANGPFSQLEQAIQPTDAQREAMAKVRDAFNRAAADLNAECPGPVPDTALGRLAFIVARLDATWRAVPTIEVALAGFQNELNGEQNARFNALQIVSAR